MDEAENQISDLVYKEAKNNQSEEPQEKRIQNNEGSISSLWDNFKHCNFRIVGVPEEEKGQKLEIYLKKIMKEKFPNLVKEIDIEVQEAQRV